MGKILVIDDDCDVCDTLHSLVSRMGLECDTAQTLQKGLQKINNDNYDVVFLDVRLPDGNGLEALTPIKETADSPEVIILTGDGDPDGAELAIQGGVWDYLVKPSPIKNIKLILNRALQYRQEKQKSCNDGQISLDLQAVVGNSPKIKKCFELVAKGARSNASVLITGQTGTGKELFARTIHNNSPRAGRDFIVVDCASLTETLVESILFGHKKGAFTGAEKDRIGLIKQADQGTLFLDEVGELPLSIQSNFLRVLQEKRFRPIGSTTEVQSNFRLIAATNRSLEKMVEQGEFRRDLFFRLKTIHLELPLLQERKEDIKALALFYIEKLCAEYGVGDKGFDPDFFAILSAYDWPGNIRELFNALERGFVSAGDSKILYAMHLPQEIRIKVAKAQFQKKDEIIEPQKINMDLPQVRGFQGSLDEDYGFGELKADLPSLKQFKLAMEKKYLQAVIKNTSADLKSILDISGLSRSHFYAMLKKHDLSL